MNPNFSKRIGVLVATALLAVVGCSDSSSSNNNGGGGGVLGTFVGTVTANGAGVAGVTVTPSPASAPAAVTDSSDKYSMPIPAGTYTLAFAGDNLQSATSASTAVAMGQKVTVDQVLQASPLVVKVVLPDALKNGGPSGFNTTVSGITATATLNGQPADASGATWTIVEAYDNSAPPAAVTPTPATGASTGFAIPDFETVRQGANLWMSTRYHTVGTPDDFEYIPDPMRAQLLSFGTQQVRAMSFKVVARVTSGGLTSTGSATVSPVTISSGANTLPLGMMVVANAPAATSYAWTLGFLGLNATSETYADATAQLQGAATKNPTVVPMESGVYKLANGADTLYFRINTYEGVGSAATEKGTDGVACADCHAGQYSLDGKFAEWNASAHGNFYFKDPFTTPAGLFKTGVTGVQGDHYSESCISCHVVGYSKVPTAVNDGFDDVAKATGWTFPTTYDAAAWDKVTANPGILHRAGIQCESCHGPLESSHGGQPETIPALFARPLAPTAGMSAGVCLVCHDALTHHDRGSLWSASPHAATDLVLADAVVEARGTSAAHCGRCHAAEGFMVYLPQQQGGVASNIVRPATLTALTAAPSRPASTNPANTYNARLCTPSSAAGPVDPGCICGQTADWKAAGLNDPTLTTTWADAKSNSCYHDPEYYDYLKGIGLNTASAHSQTCQTCHDPHSTELRVDGDTKVVAAGFNVTNAGAGALCIVCHNSRVTAPIYADSDKTSYSAPHAASQGDVFAGRSAYFVGPNTADGANALPNEAAHKFMGDTCVDCHVKWVPSDVQAQFQPANTNHTFRTTFEVCAECHAAGIGERIAEQFTEKMTALSNAIGVLYKAKLNAGGTDAMDGYTLDDTGAISDTKLGAKVTVAAGSVVGIKLAEFHGQPALIVTLSNGTVFGNNMGSFKLTSTALFGVSTAQQKIMAKAFFNYLLLHGGAAEGVHNPAFANAVLDATMTQVATVTAL